MYTIQPTTVVGTLHDTCITSWFCRFSHSSIHNRPIVLNSQFKNYYIMLVNSSNIHFLKPQNSITVLIQYIYIYYVIC